MTNYETEEAKVIDKVEVPSSVESSTPEVALKSDPVPVSVEAPIPEDSAPAVNGTTPSVSLDFNFGLFTDS